MFGTVGERGCRETEGETDRQRERERQTETGKERERERERAMFAQRGRAPQSGLSLAPVLTPVCVCCGEAVNRGMCEAFVNTNTQTGAHRGAHTPSPTCKAHAPSGLYLHRYRRNAPALAVM